MTSPNVGAVNGSNMLLIFAVDLNIWLSISYCANMLTWLEAKS